MIGMWHRHHRKRKRTDPAGIYYTLETSDSSFQNRFKNERIKDQDRIVFQLIDRHVDTKMCFSLLCQAKNEADNIMSQETEAAQDIRPKVILALRDGDLHKAVYMLVDYIDENVSEAGDRIDELRKDIRSI